MEKKEILKVEKADIAGWKITTPDETYYIGEYGENHGCFMNEGTIYKDRKAFETGEGICYIPEYGFNNENQNDSELFEFWAKEKASSGITNNPYITTTGYTRQDLIDLCGSAILAQDMFDHLDWMCPETLWQDFCSDSDENDYWIESCQYYDNFYVKEFYDTHDKGMEPVCYEEFYHNEWQDEEYRKECLKKLHEIGLGGDFE